MKRIGASEPNGPVKGWRLFPKACLAVRPPRRSKPLSGSTSPTWLASNRPAAMAAISNAPERRMRQLCREEIESGCDPIRARLLDPGCGAMT
jgi:hypothetical protein